MGMAHGVLTVLYVFTLIDFSINYRIRHPSSGSILHRFPTAFWHLFTLKRSGLDRWKLKVPRFS